MKETWKDIPGYDGKYQLDTEGRIRRVYLSGRTKMLAPYPKRYMSGSKRVVVKLTKNGKIVPTDGQNIFGTGASRMCTLP